MKQCLRKVTHADSVHGKVVDVTLSLLFFKRKTHVSIVDLGVGVFVALLLCDLGM